MHFTGIGGIMRMKFGFGLLALFVFSANSFSELPFFSFETGAANLQSLWIEASPHAKRIWSEMLGESGGLLFAQENGWTPLFLRPDASMAQGLDQIFLDATGFIHVVECKGGNSPLGFSYGYRQDTIEWVIKSAEYTYRHATSLRQQQEAANVILSAYEGRCDLTVLRTKYNNGIPNNMAYRTISGSDETVTLAGSVIDDLARDGISIYDDVARSADEVSGAVISIESGKEFLSQIDDIASRGVSATDDIGFTIIESFDDGVRSRVTFGHRNNSGLMSFGEQLDDGSRAIHTELFDVSHSLDDGLIGANVGFVAKLRTIAPSVIEWVGVAGILVDGYLRVGEIADAQNEYSAGAISILELETREVRELSGFIGGMYGALGGAKIGVIAGGSIGSLFPGSGNVVGGITGGIVGGVVGFVGGEYLVQIASDKIMNQLHYRGKSLAIFAYNLHGWASTAWNVFESDLDLAAGLVWSGASSSTAFLESKMNSIEKGIYTGSDLFWDGIDSGEQWSGFLVNRISNGINITSVLFWEGIESGGQYSVQTVDNTFECVNTTSSLFWDGLGSGGQWTRFFVNETSDNINNTFEQTINYWGNKF